MILEASAVDVATDYPAKAIWRWAQAAASRWLLPSPPLLHRHRGPGQAQASAPALQLNQGLITPVIQPSPVAGAVTQAIPTDDRQPLPVPALVNRGLATAESGCSSMVVSITSRPMAVLGRCSWFPNTRTTWRAAAAATSPSINSTPLGLNTAPRFCHAVQLRMSPPAPAVHRDGPGTAGEGAEPVRWAAQVNIPRK